MKFRSGYTRWVVLLGDRAYKISLFRFDAVIVAILTGLVKKLKRREMINFSAANVRERTGALRQHLYIGLLANRAEVKHWRCTKDPKCVPVLSSWFWGMIIVQPRVEIMNSYAELFRSSARRYTYNDEELIRPEQWGWFNGCPKIVDYAHLGNPDVL